MNFGYAQTMRTDFPELVSGALRVEGITGTVDVSSRLIRFTATAAQRLQGKSESDLPEIQAWRRGFARMGLKPTQYRCASEALLRRFRKEGALPCIHPLIDLCNAASLAFAIPVAALDADKIAGALEVGPAKGTEIYEAFSGATETPESGEIIFADAGGYAHARRWTNRQSRRSAIQPETRTALIVAEALHEGATGDVERLIATLEAELSEIWQARIVRL